MTTFACVEWGNYCGRGREYVNKLYDMIRRNVPDDHSFRFVCLTDNPRGLCDGVESLPLPKGIKGWWNKLYLFKPGLFPEGERIIYFDLDTVITGPLNDLLDPKGYYGEQVRFAILRDFYNPENYGPGVMMWQAGEWPEIWDYYEADGYPTDLPMGDLDWINAIFKKTNYIPHILQRLYPGQIGSFKVHAQHGLPKGMRIVCFHGYPRPHEAGGWAEKVWDKGYVTADIPIGCNTSDEILWDNIRATIKRSPKWLKPAEAHEKHALLVGGGPSLKYELHTLREMISQGATVFALNGALNYLTDIGIAPDACVVMDARKENLVFVERQLPVSYYLASQCDASLFDHLSENNVTAFHIAIPGMIEAMGKGHEETAVIGGGRTVGLNAMVLAWALGYRNIHLFGYDSSFEESQHAYAQPLNDGATVLEVEYEGQKFFSSPAMIQQAYSFQNVAAALIAKNTEINIHGYGLLPYVASYMAA